MAKRSKSLQKTVDQINEILKSKYVTLSGEDGYIMDASSASEQGSAYKQGLADALETMLHNHDCYRGYVYNEVSIDGVFTVSKKHERKYY